MHPLSFFCLVMRQDIIIIILAHERNLIYGRNAQQIDCFLHKINVWLFCVMYPISLDVSGVKTLFSDAVMLVSPLPWGDAVYCFESP